MLSRDQSAAGVDLCLHVVRSDHGSQVANRAARRSVVPPWRDCGQSQYIDSPIPERADASTAAARAWAVRNLDQALDLEVLAGHARMSLRTFTRQFRDEVGMSPGQWRCVNGSNAPANSWSPRCCRSTR